MREILMSDNEYEKYKKWKSDQEKFSKMKQNGELFFIEVNQQEIDRCNIQNEFQQRANREPWGSPKIWG